MAARLKIAITGAWSVCVGSTRHQHETTQLLELPFSPFRHGLVWSRVGVVLPLQVPREMTVDAMRMRTDEAKTRMDKVKVRMGEVRK